jgi:dTDP-4-dehydrorhamnose 3,5-epimerase-like enzyme
VVESLEWDRSDVLMVDLDDTGDARGESYSIPGSLLGMIGTVQHIHVTTLRDGHVRGNHYHARRHELIMVSYGSSWSLHWDRGENTDITIRDYDGTGAVLIAIPPFASHAIRNDGAEDLKIVAMTDGPYSPDDPDTFRREVVNYEVK